MTSRASTGGKSGPVWKRLRLHERNSTAPTARSLSCPGTRDWCSVFLTNREYLWRASGLYCLQSVAQIFPSWKASSHRTNVMEKYRDYQNNESPEGYRSRPRPKRLKACQIEEGAAARAMTHYGSLPLTRRPNRQPVNLLTTRLIPIHSGYSFFSSTRRFAFSSSRRPAHTNYAGNVRGGSRTRRGLAGSFERI